MVSRIQNRNTGYSENLFSHNPRVENNTFSSIDGATALKLDESYELNEEERSNSISRYESSMENNNEVEQLTEKENTINNIPSGVSIESASYIENSNLEENEVFSEINDKGENEHTPKLFSEEQSYQSDEFKQNSENQEINSSEELFDHDINEEEDFEIPAFLRKQKF